MMKYIDADKLKSEIERLKDEYTDIAIDSHYGTVNANSVVDDLEQLLSTIDSLHQEQQKANEVEKALSLQIQAYLTTASDELYAPGKPLYTKEHREGIHECMKMWQKLHHYYFSTKQEQPEVELNEETIINEFRVIRDKCFNEGIEGWQREKLIARHFYELGLNATKEE